MTGTARIVLFLSLAVCALFALTGTLTRAENRTPVIALTRRPAYGENTTVQGVVFMEDGGAFDASRYRISLYLQLTEGGEYWIKPTYENPCAEIAKDGSFSVLYATGGNDLQAQILHVLLIPADFTPGNDFAATRANALDYVRLTRPAEGPVTVEPDRPAPEPGPEYYEASPLPSGLLPVRKNSICVDVGFYTDGSQPGTPLRDERILRQLNAAAAFADTVRFYGSAGPLYRAYTLAHELGFKVAGTAYLSRDNAASQAELDALIEHCNNGLAQIAIVGNETLLGGVLTAEELTASIRYVRDRLNNPNIPVTTSDSADELLAHPDVLRACNIIIPNCYPYWTGSNIEDAAADFISKMELLSSVSGEKELVVSETGWPTAGETVGAAVPGEAEAARYYAAVRAWSLSTNTQVFYFDAADEPWKASAETETGAHWGFMTPDFALKDCYKEQNPFRQDCEVRFDELSETTAAASLTNHTGADLCAVFAAAAYDSAGKMRAVQAEIVSLGSGERAELKLACDAEEGMTEVRAFVMSVDRFVPLCKVLRNRVTDSGQSN